MSASRTLLRKNPMQMLARRKRLGRKVKPGTMNLHALDVSGSSIFPPQYAKNGLDLTYEAVGLEATYHATKGMRVRKADR